MTCQSPPPLSDDEISAALAGTAEDEVFRHIAACPYCARRVEAARRIEAALSGRLFRWDCPDARMLGEYHLKLLSEGDARWVGEHVAACESCQAELADLAAFLERTESEPAPQAPHNTHSARSLVHLLTSRAILGRVLPPQLQPALRGGSENPIVVEAGGITLFLKVEPGAGRPALLGQLAGSDLGVWHGALIQLWQDGTLRATAEVSDLGTFHCEGFLLQPFELYIAAPGGPSIVVPEIRLDE